jgi:hypothetical protein
VVRNFEFDVVKPDSTIFAMLLPPRQRTPNKLKHKDIQKHGARGVFLQHVSIIAVTHWESTALFKLLVLFEFTKAAHIHKQAFLY